MDIILMARKAQTKLNFCGGYWGIFIFYGNYVYYQRKTEIRFKHVINCCEKSQVVYESSKTSTHIWEVRSVQCMYAILVIK